MSSLTLCFPGGAGGNWLSNLIHCLEHNIPPQYTDLHFHDHSKSSNVVLTHQPHNKKSVFFNGTALFNIYLNVVVKLRYGEQNIHTDSIQQQFETMASEGSSKLFFLQERTDIDWNDIFVNQEQFCNSLHYALNTHNIIHHGNNEIISQAIINYRNSCVDPDLYFGNFDNIYWLGWCNGISKHLWQDWPLVDSIEQMQNAMRPKQEFFKEFTKQYTLDINA